VPPRSSAKIVALDGFSRGLLLFGGSVFADLPDAFTRYSGGGLAVGLCPEPVVLFLAVPLAHSINAVADLSCHRGTSYDYSGVYDIDCIVDAPAYCGLLQSATSCGFLRLVRHSIYFPGVKTVKPPDRRAPITGRTRPA
jgi:hypothetical protein